MNQLNNNILPAIRNIKDLEKLIKTDYGIAEAKSYRVFYSYRFDKGLSHDEFVSEFIIQQYKPKGIVSTKSKVIKAKSLNTLTILEFYY